MTGVLALAQGLAPGVVVPYLGMFFAGIMALALGLIAARRFLGAPPSHGYVLDINAVSAHAGQGAAGQGSGKGHRTSAPPEPGVTSSPGAARSGWPAQAGHALRTTRRR